MRRSFIIGAVIALLSVIFALQNADQTAVTLFFWKINPSIALLLLITLLMGMIVGVTVILPSVYKRNKLIAEQKKRIDMLEKSSRI